MIVIIRGYTGTVTTYPYVDSVKFEQFDYDIPVTVVLTYGNNTENRIDVEDINFVRIQTKEDE